MGGLDRLKDKRVGIIGTGATAVQCVPHLGAAAKQLYVFQRTPSSIDVRANRPTDPDWAQSLQPGWQQHAHGQFQHAGLGRHRGGGSRQRRLDRHHRQSPAPRAQAATEAGRARSTAEQLMQLADFKKMEQIRARVDQIVADRTTAEALKP